jgi:hypothetical protein
MLAVVWTLNVSNIPPAKADIPVSPSDRDGLARLDRRFQSGWRISA